MVPLDRDTIHYFTAQGIVLVSTLSADGSIHNSCKGIAEVNPEGMVYLVDLYHGTTYQNLINNPALSICSVDEHRFKGYCLKGQARLDVDANVSARLLKEWEDRVTSRLTRRMLRNLSGEKGHPRYPETLLPGPKYIIAMRVERIVNLTPGHVRDATPHS